MSHKVVRFVGHMALYNIPIRTAMQSVVNLSFIAFYELFDQQTTQRALAPVDTVTKLCASTTVIALVIVTVALGVCMYKRRGITNPRVQELHQGLSP